MVAQRSPRSPCAGTIPVGFEPTRGDPIGLAGRRLSRSAKVSAEDAKRTHAAFMRAREHTAAPLLPGRAAAPASSLSNASDYVQQGQPAAGVELGKWLCSRLGGATEPVREYCLAASAENDTCGIRAHAGKPHRLSRPTP